MSVTASSLSLVKTPIQILTWHKVFITAENVKPRKLNPFSLHCGKASFFLKKTKQENRGKKKRQQSYSIFSIPRDNIFGIIPTSLWQLKVLGQSHLRGRVGPPWEQPGFLQRCTTRLPVWGCCVRRQRAKQTQGREKNPFPQSFPPI